MKILLFIFIAFTMITALACEDESETPEQFEERIIYIKDSRTNLCFAKLISENVKGSITSITCVPCDSTKHLLK